MARRGRRQYPDERVFFVTTSVWSHARVFAEDRYCDLLVKNIKYYQKRYEFEIYGYVIMPTHFHWIVATEPALGTLSDVMRDVKKYSAWDIMSALELDRRSDISCLFKQAGNEFPGQKRKFWTKRFDDEVIRNEGMLRTKLEYIHNNPVKAGLVEFAEDFKYSSARNYSCGDHSILRVNTESWV